MRGSVSTRRMHSPVASRNSMALAAAAAAALPLRSIVTGSSPRRVWLRPARSTASVAASNSSNALQSQSRWMGRRLVIGLVGAGIALKMGLGGGRAFASTVTKEKSSLHDFTVKNVEGQEVDLSIYKGKVLLVVNVASQCGLTSGNYKELTQLHKKYRDQGFEILAFPCNQFGGQEPGSNEQIKEFACSRYKAEFPIFDKVDVNGPSTAPVYQFLKSSKGGLLGDSIKWNFGKFLVDKEGKVVERYAPTTSPLQIEDDIKKLL